MRKFILLLMLWSSVSVTAQVNSNKRITFTGTQDSLRQLQNLGTPYDTLNAISASDVLANTVSYGTVTGNDSLTVSIFPAPMGYSEGMTVSFLSDSSNSKATFIRINNNLFVPLLTEEGDTLSQGFLFPGQMNTIVFDGTAFRLSDFGRLKCPQGFVQVTKDYCIEENENSASLTDDAVSGCFSKGARLCTYGQWYYACQKSGLGLQNMTDNWEWIDDSANHANTHGQAGENGCNLMRTITIPTTLTFTYRCCYLK